VQPIDQVTLVNAILAATAEVFEVMLNLEITAGPAYREPPSSEPFDGVVALVGLAGPWVGTGIIQCDTVLARVLFSHLLGVEETPGGEGVDGEVLDAVAEIANMIVGNVKNALEEHLGTMGMSIPTVVFGRNFTTRGGGSEPWTIVPFTCRESSMLVKVCLTHCPEAAESRRGAAVPRGFAL
jgi:chemotaxis protein CheX